MKSIYLAFVFYAFTSCIYDKSKDDAKASGFRIEWIESEVYTNQIPFSSFNLKLRINNALRDTVTVFLKAKGDLYYAGSFFLVLCDGQKSDTLTLGSFGDQTLIIRPNTIDSIGLFSELLTRGNEAGAIHRAHLWCEKAKLYYKPKFKKEISSISHPYLIEEKEILKSNDYAIIETLGIRKRIGLP